MLRRFFCSFCIGKEQSANNDVSGVRLTPLSNGDFVVAKESFGCCLQEEGNANRPCIALKAIEASIVYDDLEEHGSNNSCVLHKT